MKEIIKVEQLKKGYGKVQAVRGIDLYVKRGTLFAFLGTNGAGKSTTIDILCTLLAPDEGRVLIDGHELGKEDAAIRSKIGVVFQDSVLDRLLTVKENLVIRARFYGLAGKNLKEAVNRAAHAASVTEFLNRPYGKLSGGQRRRADIARALINTPSILFLDEPTTGLDPKTKEEVWNTVTSLQKETGMTVFLTTHYMEEAATANYITLINHGKIAANGTPYELKEQYSTDRLVIKANSRDAVLRILSASGVTFTEEKGLITAKLQHTITSIPILKQAEQYLESFEVIHGSMNDVFLNITEGESDHA